jgi:hypothetical protein
MRTPLDLSIVDRTRDQLRELGAQRGPIIVGPWLSEIGFELLYWIPFLRWAITFGGLHADDLWIVSRGGCRSWYADLGAHYVDVLKFYSPAAFRAGNDRRMAEQSRSFQSLGLRHDRPTTKHVAVTAFDREILAHVTRDAGVSSPRLLHPSMMYTLFRLFWRKKVPQLYDEMTTPLRLPSAAPIHGLPKSYVAVKFYASEACPYTPANARMVQDIVTELVKTTDVVLLHTGTRYDDHGEFPIARHPRVYRLPMEPATNLETQTSALAGATSFIGTYGGFAYLAPFLGVKAKTFYASPNFRRDHRKLMDHVCRAALGTSFTVDLIGGGAGKVTRRRSGRRHAA